MFSAAYLMELPELARTENWQKILGKTLQKTLENKSKNRLSKLLKFPCFCSLKIRKRGTSFSLINKRPELVIGTQEERFWAKVEKTETCWLWRANRLPAGYGIFGVGGRAGGTCLAHRFSYELVNGPIAEGMVIDHLCRVPSCVRPEHLEMVTQRENNLRNPNTQFRLNAAKTHCKWGHEFTPENTIRRADKPNYRGCRACGRIATAKYQSKTGTVH